MSKVTQHNGQNTLDKISLHVCGTYNGGTVPRLLWGIGGYLYVWYLNFLVGLLLHVVMMQCN